MFFEMSVIVALLLDWIIGDPRWFAHPVRLIGILCQNAEKLYRNIVASPLVAGCLATASILVTSLGVVTTLLYLAGNHSFSLQTVLAIALFYLFMALKDLLKQSRAVYDCLAPQEDLTKARAAVAHIVGRDTTNLDREGICKACVETVAENLVDGITAPLFWAVVFSLFSPLTPFNPTCMATVGITFYKTINTMDSMFGYRNTTYNEFGWLPARIDDLVNFIPARLTGLAIVVIAMVTNMNWRNSYHVLLRDRLKHPSPNAGHPEAAVAGALNLQLGGMVVYFGKRVEKPLIGEGIEQISAIHILKTQKLVLYTSIFILFALLLTRKLVVVFFELHGTLGLA